MTFQFYLADLCRRYHKQIVYSMGDVRGIVKRLAFGARSPQIEAKAFEYVRLATARLGTNALGNVGLMFKTRMDVPMLSFLRSII